MNGRSVVSTYRYGRVIVPVQAHVATVYAESVVCARCGSVLDSGSTELAVAVCDPAWELVCDRCLTDADKATRDAVESSFGIAAYVPVMPADVAVVVPDRNPLGDAT